MAVELGSIDTRDLNKLRKYLSELEGKLGDRIFSRALVAGARVIAKRAKTPNYRFRDRSGRLRKTIKAARSKGARNVWTTFAVVKMGGPGARQAYLIEMGHSRAKGRTPLMSARDETREQQLAVIKEMAVKEERKAVDELKSGRIRRATARALAG